MAGCYGNSAEDRYYEKMLDDHLDEEERREEEEDYACELCGSTTNLNCQNLPDQKEPTVICDACYEDLLNNLQ